MLQREANAAFPDMLKENLGMASTNMSLFERLLKICKSRGDTGAFGMLDSQARMHEDIQYLANELFYGGALRILPGNERQTARMIMPENEIKPGISDDIRIEAMLAGHRAVFIDSLAESEPKINRFEARLAVDIIKKIKKINGRKFNARSIGVIAPFRLQCNEIMKLLPKSMADEVMVDTVERYQGSEKDIIIITFAVNSYYHLNSLSSIAEIDGILVDRKLNVSITRARDQLIMIGSSQILARNPVFRRMINIVKAKGSFFPADYFFKAE